MPCREDFLARRLFFSIFPQIHFSLKKNLFDLFLAQLLISIPWTGTFVFCCQKKRNRKAFFGPTGTYGLWILKSSSIPHHLKGFHLLNNLKMQTAMIFVFVFWWWLPPKLLLWLSNVMNCAGSYSKGLIALPKILAACNFVCLDSIYLSARAFLPRPYMKPVH